MQKKQENHLNLRGTFIISPLEGLIGLEFSNPVQN